MAKANFKVGHTVQVDDSKNWYNGREVTIMQVWDNSLYVSHKTCTGGEVLFSLSKIHAKYNEYQD